MPPCVGGLARCFPWGGRQAGPRGSSWTMFCKQTFRKLLRAVTWPGGAGLRSVASRHPRLHGLGRAVGEAGEACVCDSLTRAGLSPCDVRAPAPCKQDSAWAMPAPFCRPLAFSGCLSNWEGWLWALRPQPFEGHGFWTCLSVWLCPLALTHSLGRGHCLWAGVELVEP